MEELGSYAGPYVISISLILIIEMVAGFLSNMLVLLSYHVNKQFQQNASDLIITNMNIVDLAICVISIPLTLIVILKPWDNPFACYMHEATISFASVASAMNVLVISLDRHDKITNPIKRRISVRTVRWIIVITWVLSMIGFITPFVGIRGDFTLTFPDGNNSSRAALCYEWFQVTRTNNYYELYHVPMFFLAVAVMVYAYYSIIRVTRTKTIPIHNALVRATVVPFPGRSDQGGSTSGQQSTAKPIEREHTPNSSYRDPEKRVSLTTTVILLTFITCWGPHTAISIVILAQGRTELYDLLEWWFAALAYTTILTHPILYVFMRRNFRRAFRNSCIGRLLCRNRVAPAITPTPSMQRIRASKRLRKAATDENNLGKETTVAPTQENRENAEKLQVDDGTQTLRTSARIQLQQQQQQQLQLQQKRRRGNIEAPPLTLFITLTTGLDIPTTSDNFVRATFTSKQSESPDNAEGMCATEPESLNVQNVE